MERGSPSVDAIQRWENEGGATGRQGPTVSGERRGPARGPRGRAKHDGGTGPDAVRLPGEHLPVEAADWFTKPFARFLKIEVAAAVALLVAAVAAMVVANTPWSAPFDAFWESPVGLRFGDHDFSRTLRHWINDGLMTLFFFVVALELKREFVLGELRHLRIAALSFAGALGGIVVPACFFLAIMRGRAGVNGWGVVTATDTAFALGCLALLGSRIPASLRLFVLTLAIFDDVGAVLVVALGYGGTLNWSALLAALLGLSVVAGAERIGVRSIPVYFVLGAGIWVCFDASGIHPTVAGVALGLLAPTGRWVTDVRLRSILGRVLSRPQGEPAAGETAERRQTQRAGRAARESVSPVERLEVMLHPWVGFVVLPVFALANAGVALSVDGLNHRLVAAIVASFVVGKPIGVLGFSWLAVRIGIAAKPPGLTWPLIASGALLTGIGFTMALFIAALALTPEQFNAARIGILLASVTAAAAGTLALFRLSGRAPTRRSSRAG